MIKYDKRMGRQCSCSFLGLPAPCSERINSFSPKKKTPRQGRLSSPTVVAMCLT